MGKRRPLIIVTDWLSNIPTWAEFSRDLVELINRHPNRRAFILYDASRTHCRVVDDAVPIYDGVGRIVDWARPE